MSDKCKKLYDMLKNLIDEKYFGKIVIVFNSGKIVHIIKEESLKLE